MQALWKTQFQAWAAPPHPGETLARKNPYATGGDARNYDKTPKQNPPKGGIEPV